MHGTVHRKVGLLVWEENNMTKSCLSCKYTRWMTRPGERNKVRYCITWGRFVCGPDKKCKFYEPELPFADETAIRNVDEIPDWLL